MALFVVVCAAAAAAAPAAVAADVIGQWRFDEAAGQVAVDDGPYGLDGRLGSSDGADDQDPERVPGLEGGALRFGSDDLVRLPDAPETAPATMTVDAVVRAEGSPGSYRYVLARGNFGCETGSYGLYTGPAGGLAFYVDGSDAYHLSASARTQDVWDGAWHHVLGAFDGTWLRLYIDGRPVGDAAPGPAAVDYSRTAPSLYIGNYIGGSCQLPFGGDVDLLRLWRGGVDGTQAGELAQQALHPGSTPVPPVTPPAPLPAALPGVVIRSQTPASPAPPASTPGAPARACRMTLSPRRLPPGRRTLSVRVTVRGVASPKVRVRVRRTGHPHVLASARTGRDGRARLRATVRPGWRLRLTAGSRPTCAPVTVKVLRRRAG